MLNIKLEMYIPLRPIARGNILVSINRAPHRNWQTKLLDRRKVTQLNLLRQEGDKEVWLCWVCKETLREKMGKD